MKTAPPTLLHPGNKENTGMNEWTHVPRYHFSSSLLTCQKQKKYFTLIEREVKNLWILEGNTTNPFMKRENLQLAWIRNADVTPLVRIYFESEQQIAKCSWSWSREKPSHHAFSLLICMFPIIFCINISSPKTDLPSFPLLLPILVSFMTYFTTSYDGALIHQFTSVKTSMSIHVTWILTEATGWTT